ncbi:amidohydrolase [Polynucleobacter sp. MG-27-Goln-C1]|uniref:amidohydrolase n=1 Tax=Polynucleobacter sp. MG-27-Goln-C1 TaxID=1819726 RepID=UPI001C0D74DE|nr:amidohydrolase [Polynucleobacter sp. MG-27-Goln-C1]MBU3612141.1 amidohydrolase family protein [Polynucleobacter sp. MG-27-Goln-C1]
MKFAPKLLSALLMAQCAVTFAKGNADTIFYGGPIVTVNAKNEEVQALAVQNGKIVAVGSKDAVTKEWQADNTKVVDLKGQTLMPGFVEPHVHVILTTVFERTYLNLTNFDLPYDTVDSITAKLKANLKNVPKGGWLAAFGTDPSRTSPFMAELTADDLDKVSTEVPIFVVNQSAHLAYANHKALELAGITDSTPNPPGGGSYVRDAKGKLTGKMMEAPAFYPVFAKIPVPTQPKLIEAVQATMNSMASKGVTSVADLGVGGNFGVEKEVAIYRDIFGRNASPIRLRGYLYGTQMPAGFNAIKPNEGDDYLRFIGIKYVSDGSVQGLTGAVNEPYLYPKGGKSKGTLNFKDDELYNLIKPYYDQGWQIAIHSNGDRAIDQTLKNYEKLLSGGGNSKDRRLRIEHYTVSNPAQIKKTVKLGVVPSFTIGHVDYWGAAFNNEILGPDRAKHIDSAGDFKRAGGRFTLNSDAPVSNVSPLNYISEEVTRLWQLPPQKVLGPDQAVSVDDAIRAVTIDPAYSMFTDKLVGSLEVGKQADLVVLAKNPRTTPPAEIRNIKVMGTYIDGKPVALK